DRPAVRGPRLRVPRSGRQHDPDATGLTPMEDQMTRSRTSTPTTSSGSVQGRQRGGDDGTGRHLADSHDLIRVHGARENNLRDVSLEIPKRRLTVFTGVSGSGKSSLVFGTIAAESRRMINETYSAFLQGFMPSMARPDVDVLEGLTT